MIAAAGGSPFSPRVPNGPTVPGNENTLGGAMELLERVLELTRSAVERLEDGSIDEALHLLEWRDRLFGEAGEALGRISAEYQKTAGEGHLQAISQKVVIEELTTTAAELGRLDSWIARRLLEIQGRIEAELVELEGETPEEAPLPASPPRHLDLLG